MKRKHLSSGHSKKMFSRTASHVHKRNVQFGNPMRGGIRL